MASLAGIVLAGGRSTRMGAPKAALEWHGVSLLQRVSGILARAVDGPVVVVRARGQQLPPLPAEMQVVEDELEGRGPLQGLAAGLAAVERDVEAAYVSATDVPLLHPAFVRAVLGALDGAEIALPNVRGHRQPLAAAYRTSVRPVVDALLKEGELRLACLAQRARVRELDARALLADSTLAAADPALESLLNLNTPADYEAVRRRPPPEVLVERYAPPAPGAGMPQRWRVRAATLGAAAAAAGLMLSERVVATVNGDRIRCDPQLPLVAGDVVALRSAEGDGSE